MRIGDRTFLLLLLLLCHHFSSYHLPNNIYKTYYYYHYCYSLRVFHISVSWWSFTWVWVTARPHQVSRNLLSFLADLGNAVVWMVLLLSFYFPSPPVLLLILWWLPKTRIIYGISLSWSIVCFFFSSFLVRSMYLFFFSLLLCGQLGQQNPQFCKLSFFLVELFAMNGYLTIHRNLPDYLSLSLSIYIYIYIERERERSWSVSIYRWYICKFIYTPLSLSLSLSQSINLSARMKINKYVTWKVVISWNFHCIMFHSCDSFWAAELSRLTGK